STVNRDSYQKMELTPQMEKITREILIKCVRDKEKRSFTSFFQELRNFAKANEHNTSILMTVAAIENRFMKFTTGILGEILNTDRTTVSFEEIMKQKVVFDLSNVIYKQGTKEDVRLLMNIILKYAIDEALRRGVTNELRHLTVIEDAQLLVPSILRELSETTLGEDIPLLLRGVGESMISIATRPEISSDIVSNSAVKISFRLTEKTDTDKVSNYQNLNEEQVQYLRTMPKREAIVSTLNVPFPFRMQVPEAPKISITLEEIYQSNLKNFDSIFKNDGPTRNHSKNLSPIFPDMTKLDELSTNEKELFILISHLFEKSCIKKSAIMKKINIESEKLENALYKFVQKGLLFEHDVPVFESNMDRREVVYCIDGNINPVKKMIIDRLARDFGSCISFNKDENDRDIFTINSNQARGLVFLEEPREKSFMSTIKETFTTSRDVVIIFPTISRKQKARKILNEVKLSQKIQLYSFNHRDWNKLSRLILQKDGSDETGFDFSTFSNYSREEVSSNSSEPFGQRSVLPINIDEFCDDVERLNGPALLKKYSRFLDV
ncbi:MAG: ATP-binding protein, partial [Candidatus Helarchaeales archaeon]